VRVYRLLFIFLLGAVPCFSQTDPNTVITEQNFEEYAKEIVSDYLKSSKDSQVQATESKNAKTKNTTNDGAGTSSSVNLTSSNDFSQFFSGIYNFVNDEDIVVLKMNFSKVAKDMGITPSIQFEKKEAKLNPEFETAFADTMIADQISGLEDEIDDLDNITSTFSLSLENLSFGRNFNKKHNAFINKYYFHEGYRAKNIETKVIVNEQTYLSTTGVTTYQDLKEKIIADLPSIINQTGKSTFTLDQFVTLVQNQPQAYINITYNTRDELVGRNEYSAKLNYEMPFGNNLKKVIKAIEDEKAENDPKEARKIIAEELNTPPPTEKERKQVLFSFEYRRQEAYDDSFLSQYIEDAFESQINLEQTEVLCGSLVFGMPIGTNWRVDLGATYEDFESESLQNDKLIAELAFTLFGSKNTQYPLTLRYVNNPDLLGEVDQKFSAQFGLRWRTTQ
jgi:hypothetical protein